MQLVLAGGPLGEILDRTFAIYRKDFLLFVGIAALPATLMLGIHGVDIGRVHTERLIPTTDRDELTAWGLVVAYGYFHISGFLAVLTLPAFVRAVSRVLFDESNSIVGSLRFIAARWRTYLCVAFLKICAQLVVPELLAFGLLLACAYLSYKLHIPDESPLLFVLVLLFIAGLVVAFFWIGACIAFAVPAAALEEISAWKSLRRSWKLTKGSRGRIFVAWLMVFTCALILEVLAAFLIWWITTLIYAGRYYSGFNRQVYAVIAQCFFAVIGAVVGPLYPIAVTLFYYDQRSRKEGFDVEMMMEAAELGTGESGAIRNLRGGGADFEGAAEPGWSRFVKFIRSLRGFD